MTFYQTHDVTPTHSFSKPHASHTSIHHTTSKVHSESPLSKHHPTAVPSLHHSKHHKFHKHHHHHKHGNTTEVHPPKHIHTQSAHGKTKHGAPKATHLIETTNPKHHHHHHHPHHTTPIATHSRVMPSLTKSRSPVSAAPTSSQTGAPRSPAASPLEAEALKAHNDLRAKHGAKDLVWSDDLAKVAQAWGDKCTF